MNQTRLEKYGAAVLSPMNFNIDLSSTIHIQGQSSDRYPDHALRVIEKFYGFGVEWKIIRVLLTKRRPL
jgi:hypothetical protein